MNNVLYIFEVGVSISFIECLLLVDVCKTYGSGVIRTFNDDLFYLKSNCIFTFIKKGTDFQIKIQREMREMLNTVTITINQIEIQLENGDILVEGDKVTLPYDHTYVHIYTYGIYTRLRSRTQKLSVVWKNLGDKISTLWVELDQSLRGQTDGLCGMYGRDDTVGQLISENGINVDNQCLTKDPESGCTSECSLTISSYFMSCLNGGPLNKYLKACRQNVCNSKDASQSACDFYEELANQCPDESLKKSWRKKTNCDEVTCPGNLVFKELGNAFMETCSNPTLPLNVPQTKTCVCQDTNDENVNIFQQSSMYIQMETASGLLVQIQRTPAVQLYVTLPVEDKGTIKGLCGNYNDDITDEFISSSGIPEHLAENFAKSWLTGQFQDKITSICTNTDYEMYGKERCEILKDLNGPFAKCHEYVRFDRYVKMCEQSTCKCLGNVKDCLCAALGNYAKACAAEGIMVGDWRKNECPVICPKNQEFDYNMRACNRTCRSLSGHDITCDVNDVPVDGCGCAEGTHMNSQFSCVSKAQCPCYYNGGEVSPGPAVINGQSCNCEDGKLDCKPSDSCSEGKEYIHCPQTASTSQRTCDSLNLPVSTTEECLSGCYCPEGTYENHNGTCVDEEDCTCMFGGEVYYKGQTVRTDCKKCTCENGSWICTGKPCPGKCQVYGDGHYQTFDFNWYTYDGECEYTLVEDDCGRGKGTFQIKAESVPCCDEALTCSRAIVIELPNKVTLTLSDMKVTETLPDRYCEMDPVYSVHTVGLYIIITLPDKGITVMWDKHTRITILLDTQWKNKVCGLCGNFDSNAKNDLQTRAKSSVTNVLEFGNSWKTPGALCSDTVNQTFPCEKHSYCSTWAVRRCQIILSSKFEPCHTKVDPQAYYDVCVQESCACEFEGKFLGFCTAVAAYAEACSEVDVCIAWRTPDLCRCYPRCSAKEPYFDENTMKCSTLENCSCFYNGTTILPGTKINTCGREW
ncbi:MUC19 protein, partial [Amia calva]|nr:MUC19 protein [Amia calva]